MALRVPVVEVLDEALAVRLRRVVLGIRRRRRAEEAPPRRPAPELVRVVDGVAGLVAQDAQARLRVAAFDLEHLRQLELRQPRVREIERNGDAGHAVRREPLVGQPVVRPERQAARVELGVDLRDALLELGALDREAEIAQAHLEQLLVGHEAQSSRTAQRDRGRRIRSCIHHSVSRSYASAMRSSVALVEPPAGQLQADRQAAAP